jgi:hypothetical protein
MKAKAALRWLVGMLAVACALALALAERQASAQQVCAQVSKPYVSGGAALAPAPGFGPGTLGGPQGGTVQLRVTNLGIAVGQQVLVGPLNVASPEIVKVLAAAPAGPGAGYMLYTVTLTRQHTWSETVYRAWSGSVCLPACAVGTNGFPACLPACPSYSPCAVPGLPPPPAPVAPGAPAAPGVPGAGMPGAPGMPAAPGTPFGPPAFAPAAPPAPPAPLPAWPAPPGMPGAPAMPAPPGTPGTPAAPGVPPPPPAMP